MVATRNCFRCGKDFEATEAARICRFCRPKGEARPLNTRLTLRETQVIELVMAAKSNKEVATALHLCEGTIKEYLNTIFRKLGVCNRTELAVWGVTNLR